MPRARKQSRPSSVKPIRVRYGHAVPSYTLRFYKSLPPDRFADCSSPFTNKRKPIKSCLIRVLEAQLERGPSRAGRAAEKLLIEHTAHEIIHGGAWHLDEETVKGIGQAIAKTIVKLGYRRVNGPERPQRSRRAK